MLVRRSSSVGRLAVHMCFVMKYRHRIFGNSAVKQRCEHLLREAAARYGIEIIELGFDIDHVHMLVDIGLYSMPQVAKILKGYSAKRLFSEFPEVKQKYFWGSGFWSPAYFFESVGSRTDDQACEYIRNQGL